jgi:hypothetical protein
MTKNLTDAQIIIAVTQLDDEVQTLADNATDANAQFLYCQAAGYTAKAVIIHQEERRWVDLPTSYSYGYYLRAAAKPLRLVNKTLSRRANRLANLINPPARKGDDEQPDYHPGTR